MRRLPLLLAVLVSLAGVSCASGGGDDGGGTTISVAVSPSSASVPAGEIQQFTATVQNTTNTVVTWQVNGFTGGSPTLGEISASGFYTAPLGPPSGGTVTIRAVSQADPSRSGSATATIVFSNASLQGRYAFTFGESDADGTFFSAGSFQADGNGNLLAGIEDVNHDLGVSSNVPFTGTYSVGADGRGSASFTSSLGISNFRLVLITPNDADLIAFGSSESGGGAIRKQDPSAFSNMGLTGDYVFGFNGFDDFGDPSTVAGRFTADGNGSIPSGVEDINNGGVVSINVAFTGSYSVASNGRGTVTLTDPIGPLQFAIYVISSSEANIISLDFLSAYQGAATKQDSASFTIASLSGDYAFTGMGATVAGFEVDAGRFSSNGSGAILDGVFDENDTGFVSENVTFTGSYAIASNGRGTAAFTSALGTSNLIFYMVNSQQAVSIGADGDSVPLGVIGAQEGGPFTNSSFSGSYGFSLVGFSLVGATTFGTLDIVGRLQANGAGGASGIEDFNDADTLSTDVPISFFYSISSNGRGTIFDSNQRFYLASGSVVAIISVDSTELFLGLARRQF